MGRAPCCDKANVKKGPWSPEEDDKLKAYIERHGTGGNWIALPQKIGLKRCGKSCRLRWLNYLRPNIKHGGFSEEEDSIICSLYMSIGSRWSTIAAQLPGRTDNDIKNYWNTRLKKKLLGKQRKEKQGSRGSCPKQQMRRGSENFLVTEDNPRNQYMPELPMLPPVPLPYSNQEPDLNDHTFIRELLIRLGGRFSACNQQQNSLTNLQFPLNSAVQQSYEHSIDMLTAAPSDASSTAASRLTNTQYNFNEASMPVLHGHCSFPVEFEEMIHSNSQKLDGLEFLSEDLTNNKSEASCGQNLNWGEMISSLVYPPTGYEIFTPGTLQGRAIGDLKYSGMQ